MDAGDALHDRITDDDHRFLDLVREHHRVEVGLNDPNQGTYRSHVGGLLDIIDDLLAGTTTTQPGCGWCDDGRDVTHPNCDHATAQPAGPEPDEREALTCVHCGDGLREKNDSGLHTHESGLQRCQYPDAPYGHMGHPSMPCPSGDINPCAGYRETVQGDGCTHLARRSRPEATHTVTAERYDAAWLAYKRNPTGTVDAGLRAALAALGVTVVDTPTQGGGDA
jgi:hypothetical protein